MNINKQDIIEEYSDDAFMYRLFYEIHGTVPYVMYDNECPRQDIQSC